ncbi:MAG: aminotransferase class I/II-fold pyridoxal phosphate-dependent enzyme [Clostridia bacterium]|nr:aminotransferase class I/II-fold pyridoxal phosphate-dependent enzyme [Clostridia bacterium]
MNKEFNINDFISPTVANMQPSGIRKFFDIVNTMEDAISLGVGEPDFVTPWHIRDAGVYSLEKGQTYYTSNSGLLELREEICNYVRKFDLNYTPDEVLVTVGGSEAIDLAMRTVLSPGDEVIIPEPSFVCYKPCTALAGGVPVTIQTKAENAFKLTAEEVLEKITAKTKLLVLSYPNNPTGAIMEKNDLERIAEVVKEKNIMVLSDEIYAELTYSGKHTSIASLPGMKERTIVVNGFSKAFAMTGWRLGFVMAPAVLTKQLTKVHQYAIMSSPTTSQYAAIEALRNGEDSVKSMVMEYNDRRKVITDAFNKMGYPCFSPLGAFYIFPCIKSSGLTSEEFCERLLREQKVALVPGTAFGESGEGFVRVSYAYSVKQITKATERIAIFAKSLQEG